MKLLFKWNVSCLHTIWAKRCKKLRNRKLGFASIADRDLFLPDDVFYVET